MSTVAVRVDDQLKDDATELFQSLGLDMSTAVKMFLIQSVKTQSIPFEIKNQSSVSDEEFQNLVETKLKGIRVKASDPESVNAFFGDEDFSEYEEYFKLVILRYILY
ncbi:TPA: type II toxin-antitoxin system RelB/DinJ family antitoxin [Streptococcus agalactiae]